VYSPREVEFYLIDFKKGVEFKPYGTLRLPHARVVAIESDREFGTQRPAAHRPGTRRPRRTVPQKRACRTTPATASSPPTNRYRVRCSSSTEFQEFFTDEDGVSQESALLLDRVIRQGRAFGIHVVLGTQTLGARTAWPRARWARSRCASRCSATKPIRR